MKRLSLYALVAAMLAVHLSPACADTNFKGDWYSIDLFTGGIPLLNISGAGTNLTIHGWGACTPTDCNWGTTTLAVVHDPTGQTNDGYGSIEDVRPEIKFRVYAIAFDSFRPGTTFYRLVH
jgi:hypothetical protein